MFCQDETVPGGRETERGVFLPQLAPAIQEPSQTNEGIQQKHLPQHRKHGGGFWSRDYAERDPKCT